MKGSIFHKMQTSTCWIVCLVLLGPVDEVVFPL